MKEEIRQLYSNGVKFFNERDYEEALKIFTLLKELDKPYIHLWYYYEGIIYYAQGETTNDSDKKTALYFNAEISFRQAAPYKSKPEDTYFLLGRTLYKEGKLKEAGTVLKKYTPCPENKEEFQEILSRIEQQPNNSLSSSQLLSRENDLSHSQLTSFNNNDSYVTRQEYNEIKAQLGSHNQRIGTLENIVKAANIDTIAKVNIKIKELSTESPELLYKYYEYFNTGLRDIYLASCSVNSGLVVPNAGHLERLKPNDWEKIACYLLDAVIVFFGPIGTAVIGVVHDAGDNIFNSHVEKNVVKILENINRLMNKQYDVTMQIETVIQQVALLFTHIKRDEILNIKATAEAQQNKFLKFFKEKVLPAQKKLFFRYQDLNDDDPIIKLVFKDLTSLLVHMQCNATEMIKNPKSFAEQISTLVEKELKDAWENKIQNNPTNVIEYNILQIENNLPEHKKIIRKIGRGQWEDLPVLISWSGIKRGVKSFFSEKYLEDNKKNIPELKDQNELSFFLVDKIFKHGQPEIITKFKSEYPELIELARTQAPQLFATEANIDLCIDNEEHRKVAKDTLKLKSSDYFAQQCVKTIFSNAKLEPKPEPAPEFVLREEALPFDINSSHFGDNVEITGVN